MTLLRPRTTQGQDAPEDAPSLQVLLAACLGVMVLRATYVLQSIRSDEGGYLLVARGWHAEGAYLYGDYFVDRPPVLMLIFRAAAVSEWDGMVRLLTIPFVLLAVVAAWWTGWLLTGRAGASWAALVAAALFSSPVVGADQADGGLFAAAFVMGALPLVLVASRWAPGRRRWVVAFAAGVLAGAAPLVKQSFLEGLIFLGVLSLATVLCTRPGSRQLGTAVAATAGAAAPYIGVWMWARSAGFSAADLWSNLMGFRGEAFGLLWNHSPTSALDRGASLLLLGIASGLFAVVALWLLAFRRRADRAPVEWAVTAVLVYGVVAIVVGGSYWPHYLIQLLPGAVVAVALLAPGTSSAGRLMRGAVMLAMGSAVVGAVAVGVLHVVVPGASYQARTGQWLAASSVPGDTAFVAYGRAGILEAADLDSPYPHLWSLPMRTRDPDQDLLTETLGGTQAPTWFVGVLPVNSWGIDADRSVRDVLERRYRVVAQVCGHAVWLRGDLARELAAPPPCWRP